MKLAVISDIHGDIVSLKKVVENIKKNNIDNIIFLGDIAIGGSNPEECFNLITSIKPLIWIRGNTDEWLAKERYITLKGKYFQEAILSRKLLSEENIKYLINRPEKALFTIEKYKLYCTHSIGMSNFNELNKLQELTNNINADIILCGHSHIQFIINCNKKIIINPGSTAQNSYIIIKIDENEIEFISKVI